MDSVIITMDELASAHERVGCCLIVCLGDHDKRLSIGDNEAKFINTIFSKYGTVNVSVKKNIQFPPFYDPQTYYMLEGNIQDVAIVEYESALILRNVPFWISGERIDGILLFVTKLEGYIGTGTIAISNNVTSRNPRMTRIVGKRTTLVARTVVNVHGTNNADISKNG